jgi:prolyl-tRNA editing enzyme YbaK/EbsC (Cys-tRNA(Pro) deacylase)
MVNEKVKEFLVSNNLGDRLTEHIETIDTVEHAAQQIGCTEPEIAKTLSFVVDEKPVIVVMAGDGKVNSSKFKSLSELEAVTGAEGWCDVCKGWEEDE